MLGLSLSQPVSLVFGVLEDSLFVAEMEWKCIPHYVKLMANSKVKCPENGLVSLQLNNFSTIIAERNGGGRKRKRERQGEGLSIDSSLASYTSPRCTNVHHSPQSDRLTE